MESHPFKIIKQWNFPSYEHFKQQRSGIQLELGEYYCSIGPSCWGEHTTTYQIAISTFEVPSNFNANKIFNDFYKINYKDRDPAEIDKEKEEMYNNFCRKANEYWEKYMTKTYLNLEIPDDE